MRTRLARFTGVFAAALLASAAQSVSGQESNSGPEDVVRRFYQFMASAAVDSLIVLTSEDFVMSTASGSVGRDALRSRLEERAAQPVRFELRGLRTTLENGTAIVTYERQIETRTGVNQAYTRTTSEAAQLRRTGPQWIIASLTQLPR